MAKEEIFSLLSKAVVEGDEDLAAKTSGEVVREKLSPSEAIEQGLSKGMLVVGDYFEKQKYFLTEVILSADAFKAGVAELKPHLEKSEVSPGIIVIGTVKGDTHDIGKNLVGIMLEAAGFTVHDAGRDVSPRDFVDKVKETGANILGLSALMTSSMANMKSVIELLEQEGLRNKVKVLVGGAPVSARYAKEIGADGYSQDASEAVQVAKSVLGIA